MDQEAIALLDNLRAFRHVFRHAYGYVLDERKVRLVLEDAIRLEGRYRDEVHAFLDKIEPQA